MPRATFAASQPYTNTFNYGSPAGPQSIVPPDLDVQIHRRDPSDAMEPMDAGHGADCSAPPATHAISTLAQGVFSCKNHLMTAIGDSGYGEIALTLNQMADWSTGTSTITFNVSTLQFNDSDWLEIWITPFADNMNLPFEDQIIDFQGPPKNAIVFSLDKSGLMGTNSGDVSFFQNYVQGNNLPKVACLNTGDPQCISATGFPSVVPPSGVTRVQYEIDISSGHIKFGLPGVVTWTDTNVSVPFSQGVVQLVHHSYNPLKHNPGTGIDTYHWSNFSISNAVPFTIINGAERSINAGTSPAIHFAAPAPTGSYLRFSALGTPSISWDSGATYHPAVLQGPLTHIEHFSSYMTPIPAGTQTILLRGVDNAYGQSWWVRDPAIWSLTASGTPPAFTACTSASMSPGVASPQPPAGTVTFTATSTGCVVPQYKFFIQPPGGSWTAQTGFGGATWGWNTAGLAPGIYGVGVWARSAGSSASYEAYWLGTYTLSSATTSCTAASVSTATASPQAAGAGITFTATATGCPSPQYRFWLLPPGGAWTMKQDYGAGSWNWNTTSLAAGTYEIGAWARQTGSASSYDTFAFSTFVLGLGTCNSAGLSPDLVTPQAPGTTVTFIGSSNGCTSPLYEYWLLPPGGSWTVAKAYTAAATWAWNTTGYALGTYQVGVWVKAAASANSHDAYFIGTYQLNVGTCTAAGISASPASPQAAGSITFTASSTGCGAPQYEFWELSPSSSTWQMVRPYGSGTTFVWNSTGGSGPYRFGVWARQAGLTSTYDSYAITTFWVGT